MLPLVNLRGESLSFPEETRRCFDIGAAESIVGTVWLMRPFQHLPEPTLNASYLHWLISCSQCRFLENTARGGEQTFQDGWQRSSLFIGGTFE